MITCLSESIPRPRCCICLVGFTVLGSLVSSPRSSNPVVISRKDSSALVFRVVLLRKSSKYTCIFGYNPIAAQRAITMSLASPDTALAHAGVVLSPNGAVLHCLTSDRRKINI